MNRPTLPHPLFTFVGALLFVGVAGISGVAAHSALEGMQASSVAAAAEVFPTPLALDPRVLSSNAAVVYDPATGVLLYSKNSAHMPLSLLHTAASATTTETTSAMHALAALPGVVGVTTYGATFAEPTLAAVFDIEVGHPLVAVVLGGTAESRIYDLTNLINAARK
jgi:D-alanyl-D-alanine carboxypeptidase